MWPSVLRKGRGVSNEHKQEEETQKEDGARDLPRPETVLDDTDAVLAVGEGRHRREDGRAAAHRTLQARARGVVGVVE